MEGEGDGAMKIGKRPLAVVIVAGLYIAVGMMGFGYHFGELLKGNPFQTDAIWVELVECVAIVCGVFMLRGQNWARWVAIAWIAAHVVISAFNSVSQFAAHGVFCVLITWVLLRGEAGRYFRGERIGETDGVVGP